ncbi:hypothetical protein [Streptomyces sp. NRRL B-1347]|uniref:hypothetical protein n=1 Tax=Streptomyces sp. NRRL B-1347 TaxID=1476877 RepID=UPI0004C68551|nr:hypothetical protein [Streptomyces sp. NRRL B-1347]
MAALAGLAGCSASEPAGPATTRPERTPSTARLPAAAVDMVTRSGTWPRTQQTLDTAVNTLVHRCMERAGFTYPARRAALPEAFDDARALVDLDRRERYGYGIATGPPDTGQPPAPYYTELDADRRRRFDLAFSGPPGAKQEVETGLGTVRVSARGCDAEARRRLAGGVVAWARMYYVPEALNGRLDSRVPRQPGYVSALARWRTCMSERGYPFPTPEKAQKELADAYGKSGGRNSPMKMHDAFRRRERAIAVADGECALEVRLPQAALAGRRALVHSLPGEDRAVLAELIRVQGAALKRAEAVIGR